MNRSNSGKRPKVRAARGERRKRTIYTKEQVEYLTKAFEADPYPGYEARERFAREVDIPEPRIHVWFQNRRARQPKPANHGKSGRQDFADSNRATGSVEFPSVPVQPVWDDSRPPPGRNWSLLGYPPTLQSLGGSQEEAPSASQNSLSVGPAISVLQSSVDWDSSAPSGSGLLLPTFPQPNQQYHLPQNPLQSHSYDPCQQQPSQNPQFGDPFCSPAQCLCPEPAVDLHRALDLMGPLCVTPGAANKVQMPQAGSYGYEGGSWENWR